MHGLYYMQLDDKNRMRIPAKLRNSLDGSFCVCQGSDDCIFVMSEEELKKFLEPTKNIPLSDHKAQMAIRKLHASIFDVEEDNQNRFVMPAVLKDHANITKKIVVLGVCDRIEIWAEEVYLNQQYSERGAFGQAVDALKEYGY